MCLGFGCLKMLKYMPYILATGMMINSALHGFNFVLQQSLLLCINFYLVDLLERFVMHYLGVSYQLFVIIIIII